ncbi:hypothetical protein HaLaN_29082 [Haematococcus lacustris]|uniref:Uncharacterized protein n=1 Tax=Haematococcus lacustris TaxID=44745 RepID=A0A6A0ADU0_HAELA|nr:hypothetical protein HaLaN_29082 [Haematococcus lacustris]
MFRMCLTSNAARKAASQVQAQAQLAAAASLAAGRSCSTNHLAGLQQQQGISAPALFPSPPPTHPVDSSSSFPAPPAQTLSTPGHTPGCTPSAPAAAAGLGGSGQGVNGRQAQQELLQATGQGHSTASPGTLEQGQGQEQQPLSEQALPHAKAQRQGQGEQGQGGAPQRQLSCVPEQGPALASSLASQHSTGLPHQYTGQELSGLPCWTSGSHLSTAFSRQSATLASNIFPDAGSPPCDPSFAGGLRISGTRRASLDCVPESPMMLGSASLRPQSMLAVKLRQLHHKAAVAAAAAAVVDGGMTSQEGANGLPAPMGVGTGQLPTVADLLDEDEMHEVLDVEALLEAYFMMAESTLATLRNIGGQLSW